MADNLGASFSIDVTNLKAGLAQANKLIRESESEFKAAAAGMDDWSGSSEGLEAQIKHLTTASDLQRKKVSALEGEYDRLIADGLDPASDKAIKLRTDINKETEALNKSEKALDKAKGALDDLADAADDAGDAVEDAADSAADAGEKFSGLKAAGDMAVKGIGAIAGAAAGALGAFLALGESTQETQAQMAKLNASFADTEKWGEPGEAATESLYALTGVLGDADRAVEASGFLAKMSGDMDDLEANTRILTGVFAEYGDSIPTEGLAEGMAATAEMGSVQGVLADALEWQGVNLDDYNAKLASMTTAEERAAYIQSTLTDIYGESADAYRENNANLIEANEAQLKLNQSLADIGAIATPIMTEIKNLTSDLLIGIQPFVELIGEGLTGALNGADGATEKLSEGLGGLLSFAVEKIAELLPTVVEVLVGLLPTVVTTLIQAITTLLPTIIDAIIQLVPQLITALLAQLPAILTMLVNVTTQLITAIATLLPTIISAIMQILPQLINSLIASIPQLLQAAITLLMAIVQAIPTIITALIEALPSIIQTIITALLEALPMLIEAAITLLMAIVEAIPTIIDALIEALPTIIDTIISGLIDAMPLLLDGAIQLFMAIIDAIPEILPEILSAMPKIITEIVTGLIEGIPQLIAAGGEMLAGLVKGMLDPVAIWNAVTGLFDGIVNGILGLFGIHSPSRVMADLVGKNLALGIGEGFEENIDGVNDMIAGSMDEITSGGFNVNGSISGGGARGGVVVNQYNSYSRAHSRYELYKSKQNTVAAVRLAALEV